MEKILPKIRTNQNFKRENEEHINNIILNMFNRGYNMLEEMQMKFKKIIRKIKINDIIFKKREI